MPIVFMCWQKREVVLIIDSHVYCLPPRLADPEVNLAASEEMITTAIHHHPEGTYALNLSSPKAISQSMEQSGIDRAVLVSLPWFNGELCHENNAFLLDIVAKDNRFMSVCAVQPLEGDWLKEAESCFENGAVGLKVNPGWQGYALDGPEMGELANYVSEKEKFLMVHVDHPYRKSIASPAHLFQLLREHPQTRFVAAHMGGLLGLYVFHPPVAEVLKNVWFDTAVSSTLELVQFFVMAGLCHKIIFGSDFPFNHSHSQRQVLEGLLAQDFDKSVRDAMFSENLLKLITRRKEG